MMALSPSQLQENLGTVVPVDDEQTVTFKIPSITNAGVSTNVPSQAVPTGPGPGTTSLGTTNDQKYFHI